MTPHRSTYRSYAHLASLMLLAASTFSGIAAAAQAPVPKVELFGGYSFFYPNATLTGTLPGGLTPVSSCLCSIPRGAGVSATYNFLPWLGLSADLSGNWGPHETTNSDRISKSSFYSLAAGPKFTLRRGRFLPFAEVLAGGARLTPELFQRSDTFGLVAGGGLDIVINRHIAFRPVRADFMYSNHTFGINPAVAPTDVRGFRLESGVVFTFGGAAHPAPAAAPAPPPSMAAVFTPAPVVAPVPVFGPPTVMCSAQPSAMNAGEASTITATGNSPQGLPLTYSYASNGGTIAANGSTGMLATAGAGAGVIEVTCNVVDSHGQTASATTSVTLAAVAVAPKPLPTDLCIVSFARDKRRPVRVDNEAKACLDDIALTLQHQIDANLIIEGSADTQEPENRRRAAERARNVKAYLVSDRGIEPSRISLYTKPGSSPSTTNILIPAGATPDVDGLTSVHETAPKP